MDLSGPGSGFVPAQPERAVYALIAALSSGFPNYRHQADALRQYWLLRHAGVPDDHIVLMLADDIATASAEPPPRPGAKTSLRAPTCEPVPCPTMASSSPRLS